jgi:hypothetical protein
MYGEGGSKGGKDFAGAQTKKEKKAMKALLENTVAIHKEKLDRFMNSYIDKVEKLIQDKPINPQKTDALITEMSRMKEVIMNLEATIKSTKRVDVEKHDLAKLENKQMKKVMEMVLNALIEHKDYYALVRNFAMVAKIDDLVEERRSFLGRKKVDTKDAAKLFKVVADLEDPIGVRATMRIPNPKGGGDRRLTIRTAMDLDKGKNLASVLASVQATNTNAKDFKKIMPKHIVDKVRMLDGGRVEFVFQVAKNPSRFGSENVLQNGATRRKDLIGFVRGAYAGRSQSSIDAEGNGQVVFDAAHKLINPMGSDTPMGFLSRDEMPSFLLPEYSVEKTKKGNYVLNPTGSFKLQVVSFDPKGQMELDMVLIFHVNKSMDIDGLCEFIKMHKFVGRKDAKDATYTIEEYIRKSAEKASLQLAKEMESAARIEHGMEVMGAMRKEPVGRAESGDDRSRMTVYELAQLVQSEIGGELSALDENGYMTSAEAISNQATGLAGENVYSRTGDVLRAKSPDENVYGINSRRTLVMDPVDANDKPYSGFTGSQVKSAASLPGGYDEVEVREGAVGLLSGKTTPIIVPISKKQEKGPEVYSEVDPRVLEQKRAFRTPVASPSPSGLNYTNVEHVADGQRSAFVPVSDPSSSGFNYDNVEPASVGRQGRSPFGVATPSRKHEDENVVYTTIKGNATPEDIERAERLVGLVAGSDDVYNNMKPKIDFNSYELHGARQNTSDGIDAGDVGYNMVDSGLADVGVALPRSGASSRVGSPAFSHGAVRSNSPFGNASSLMPNTRKPAFSSSRQGQGMGNESVAQDRGRTLQRSEGLSGRAGHGSVENIAKMFENKMPSPAPQRGKPPIATKPPRDVSRGRNQPGRDGSADRKGGGYHR